MKQFIIYLLHYYFNTNCMKFMSLNNVNFRIIKVQQKVYQIMIYYILMNNCNELY